MAKVKLTLSINNQTIRSIEDLRDNFEPFTVLGFFNTGRLRKWVESRNLTQELKALIRLETDAKEDKYSQDEVIAKLIKIFDVNTNFKGLSTNQRRIVNRAATFNFANFNAMRDQYSSLVERITRYEDKDASVRDILNQAAAEDPLSQFNVGVMYMYGEILEQDYGKALYWLERASRHVVLAKAFIGKMYKDGLGVNVNYLRAAELLSEPAENGDLLSQVDLGLLYLNGREDFSQDYHSAFKWLSHAADQGEPAAQCYLGLMYLKGRGVKLNENVAFKLFTKSANSGNSMAQYYLGCMYMMGVEVPSNPAKAREFLSLSSCQGNPEARKALSILEGRVESSNALISS